MEEVIKAGTLLFVLLNPLLMSVYLVDLVQGKRLDLFIPIIVRASLTSTVAFLVFAWLGDVIFTDVFQVRFSSFLVFGGILFLLIGLRMMLTGSAAIAPLLGGEPHRIAGAVALPFMIGPGTISASVIIGKRLDSPLQTSAAIVFAVVAAALSLVALKALHDMVLAKNGALLERYLDITGRVIAMFTGTYAVEMIARGIELWFTSLPAS
ncbi:MAG: MarC family protein [Leptospirillia bacterium]